MGHVLDGGEPAGGEPALQDLIAEGGSPGGSGSVSPASSSREAWGITGATLSVAAGVNVRNI